MPLIALRLQVHANEGTGTTTAWGPGISFEPEKITLHLSHSNCLCEHLCNKFIGYEEMDFPL